jgi:hypothetical protein
MDKFLPFLYEKKLAKDHDNYLYLELPEFFIEEEKNNEQEEVKIITIEII